MQNLAARAVGVESAEHEGPENAASEEAPNELPKETSEFVKFNSRNKDVTEKPSVKCVHKLRVKFKIGAGRHWIPEIKKETETCCIPFTCNCNHVNFVHEYITTPWIKNKILFQIIGKNSPQKKDPV